MYMRQKKSIIDFILNYKTNLMRYNNYKKF